MALNSLLTGLDPEIGRIASASIPIDILTAVFRIKGELQLRQLENQRFSTNRNYSKLNQFETPKQCPF